MMGTEPVASGESRSRTGSLLREFAKVVAVEERDLSNSTDRLIQAADEVTAQIIFGRAKDIHNVLLQCRFLLLCTELAMQTLMTIALNIIS